jgi:hypothetical protein
VSFLWPLIFAAAWVTVPVAASWHIQIFTVLLVALGVLQLTIWHITAAPRSVPHYACALDDAKIR